MINIRTTKSKCRGDFSLIQNYDKAISDKEHIWDCHHRLGTIIPMKKLLEMDLYYHRPSLELIFLLHSDHSKLHNKGKHLSDETRKKLSEKLKGENHPMYGKHFSNEHNQKLSESMKGENHPMYGKHHSVETLKKMSEKLNGEKNPMYGKRHSDESKQKNREAHQGKHRVYDDNGKFHYEF